MKNSDSFLGSADIEFVEKLYESYLNDPDSVDTSWRKFFEGFEFARKHYEAEVSIPGIFDKEFKVINLIEAYRRRGHLFTLSNPVRTRRKYLPTLDIENYGLSNSDINTVFQAGKEIGIGPASLAEIIDHLKQTYCISIGAEYLFIRKPEVISWLQERMEKTKNTPEFTNEERKDIYSHLKEAVGFEKFLHKKFVAQKSFSLEGAEILIPALDSIIEKGSQSGIEEIVIGMAHRGRLNVLANILQKPYEDIFTEFIGKKYEENIVLGDVKYHLGYGNEITTDKGKKIHINLAPNPSHLEAVNPVIHGIARAKIQHKYNNNNNKVLPIVIHGDAAISAQGVVYEVVQMYNLEGYNSGGTIHVVINNQVGFTTNYLDGRSSTYCTDIGKVTKAPIFHVNGDDVEALVYIVQLAIEYRQKFHTDVFIDILCYRRYGHSESDEPRFTQPLLYKQISTHKNTRDIYSKFLIDKGIMSDSERQSAEKEFNDLLEEKFALSKKIKKVRIKQFLNEDWKTYVHAGNKDFFEKTDTGVTKAKLIKIADRINTIPANQEFFGKLTKIVESRKEMIIKNRLNWAICELLAYGSLVQEGYPVRISGQDSERGTFSHRHSAYIIEDTVSKYIPLKQISNNQASFDIYNSPLSEYGVLGFEYGYAMAAPSGLTVWEGQFGDFYNVAQVIVDQYICSAEEKWGLINGLVLYLPHGYEGQGPEHSSARIERFLSVCAHNNIQVLNCTTPANFFHALRRHIKRNFRTPLVIFTPKSLLRHPSCISSLDDLANGSFQEIIDDQNVEVDKVTRLIFCSGKFYYNLLEKKEFLKAKDLAIIRIEQLYPFPKELLQNIIRKYKNAIQCLWVQEEPENMGPWYYIRNTLDLVSFIPVTRSASGSTAVGLHELHVAEEQEIINKVFRKCDCELNNNYCGLQCVKGSIWLKYKKQYKYF